MNLNTYSPLKVFALIICLILGVSCSKDSDLLSDYVLADASEGLELRRFVVDDFYSYSSSNSITLDVLENDQFDEDDSVEIIETSDPENGEVAVNEDNTITYTPDETNETTDSTEDTNVPEADNNISDTFTYTTEVVEEDGTVTTETGNVTLGSGNRAPISGANVYYVTVNGNSGNNGKSEASSWNIVHAFKSAKAGDVIHIKSGNYGSVNLSVGNSGTSSSPIKFIGYSNTPGDILANQGSTFEYGDAIDSSAMPLIQGNRGSGEYLGTGINSNKAYIEISNIQIRYYEYGLSFSGNNCVIDNIISVDMGNFDPNQNPARHDVTKSPYEGYGIRSNGDFCTIKNCYVANVGAQGYTFQGASNGIHSYNRIYIDNDINPCDYYYLLLKGSNNNEVRNIHVERVGDLAHPGHGLIAKYEANNNNFYDCTIVNTTLEVSRNGTTDNNFYNCDINGKNLDGGILVRDGAHHNNFYDCDVVDSSGIIFYSLPTPSDIQTADLNAGRDNFFKRCTVSGTDKNGRGGIHFLGWFKSSINTYGAYDNTFDECSFNNIPSLFVVDRPNRGTELVNCGFTNISELRTNASGNNGVSLDFSEEGSQLNNTGFSF
ncbi:right-handed parallel beta-helix repeat-containing protein [Ulvibacterium marinum]|uniref:DUF1565 domain-containing protein n=1 Tax=Ulvibacterium marinum TaxID=2419782 RepID=A0A3B0BWP4_9FLAO|nr:right-handed parallel beta-helix repeat-containing protein [Ulvibacterium marinum]RKN76951.1 hypothetical protein D7Z94_24550 [Ulvibacterium marinum]